MTTRRRLRRRLSSRASGDADPAGLPSSSTGDNTLLTPYRIRPVEIFGKTTDTIVCPDEGDQNLVGLLNSTGFLDSMSFEGEVERTEEELLIYLSVLLTSRSEKLEDIPTEEVAKMGSLAGNIRADFSLQPCLSGNCDFQISASSNICHVLSLPLLHGWVVNPEVPIYETIKEFSYDQLLEYRDNLGEGEHRAICDGLLNAAENQLTSYGFLGLSTELSILAAGGAIPAGLLYWRGKVQVILLHQGDMFIYVSDVGIVQQMPDAHYMLFEEGQQESIYFNSDLEPILGQPFQDKANEWLDKKKKAKKAEKNKEKKMKRLKNAKKNALPDEQVLPGAADTSEEVLPGAADTSEEVLLGAADTSEEVLPGAADTSEQVLLGAADTSEDVLPGAADTSKEVKSSGDPPKDDHDGKKKFLSDEEVKGLPPQQGQCLPAVQGSLDEVAANTGQEVKSSDEQPKDDQNAKTKFQSDEKVTGLPPQQDQELPARQGSLDDTAADFVQEVKSSDEQPKDGQNAKSKFQSEEKVTGLPPQQDQELPAGQGSLDDAPADLVQEVKPGQGLVAQQEVKSSGEHQDDDEQDVPAASGNVVSSHAGISVSHDGAEHKKDDAMLDGDLFFEFLMNFKERGSSGPYFKGMVAAFASHRPNFYVPYQFIMAHDEKLALKIQDDIVSISKDLDRVVAYYLKKNGVESPDDAKTNIIGLPPPKCYADDQKGYKEVDTTGDMLKDLVDSITDGRKSGYVSSEVSLLHQNQKSVFFTDEDDLTQLAEALKQNGYPCRLDGDGLRCNTISLRKKDFPASKEQAAYTAIVVEGAYSYEYDALFTFLTGWLGL